MRKGTQIYRNVHFLHCYKVGSKFIFFLLYIYVHGRRDRCIVNVRLPLHGLPWDANNNYIILIIIIRIPKILMTSTESSFKTKQKVWNTSAFVFIDRLTAVCSRSFDASVCMLLLVANRSRYIWCKVSAHFVM